MHRTLRRPTTLVAGGLIIALTVPLASCAGGDGNSSGQAGEVDGSTITVGVISQLESQFQLYANAYMEEYPDRKVEIRSISDDFEKYSQLLATSRLGDSLPDVFFNVDFLADTLADNNVTLDLAPGLAENKAGLDLEEFLPQFVGQYRPISDPDAVTGLPVSADSTALVYNKTLFDQVGVTEYPQDDWTWEDYYRVSAQIQEKSGGDIYGTVAPLMDGASLVTFGPVITAAGGTIYDPETNTSDISSPDALAAWESMINFYGTASGAYTTSADDPSLKFESGKVAMNITSRASISGMRETMADYEWDVARMPTVDGTHVSGGGSYGLSIGQTSSNQDAAWEFLGWFYDPEGGLAVAQTPEGGGIIPPTATGLSEGTWQDAETPANLKVYAVAAEDAVLLPQLPGTAGSVLTDAVRTAVQEVILNGKSVEDAFTTAQQTVDEALAAAKP
ncbi:ABC transporter substrate-binding protein [Microbacterium saperdae]|uniref:Multiple sugar transport system substrate-binding protein n=1 Tax=Microbacterium saperdae TaxID=69368 RepID=A0A543BKW8_9MICO|nr:sugar ABC transporter substrate-binding protein [Microbacterium saperdae]TQL85475.1 multiple sugar transport system substrate-binding protein [Microbacterium saperdae]GGM63487.1 ABC transporter substrate-binding protein [Microbacterium saperdae]